MTPEELAVVQAAIEWQRNPLGHNKLHDAVQRLIYSCRECNLGGHTCPGDGNPIPHGASDCGEHTCTCPPGPEDAHLNDCPLYAGAACTQPVKHGFTGHPADEQAHMNDHPAPCGFPDVQPCICTSITWGTDSDIPEPLLWVARTWRDVRQGDRVRLPGSETVAGVYAAVPIDWHVDPRTGTSSFNPPVPLEHAVMRVRFAHEDFPRDMDPDKPVEIELTASEAAALDAAGWMNRTELRKEP